MKQIIKKLAIVLSVALVCAPMGAMAANKLIVKDATGVIDKMVVTDSGYIGVGLNAPIVGIHAKGSTIPSTQILSQYVGSDPNGSGGFLAYRNNPSTTNNGLPQSGNRIGYMLFGSFGSDGISPRNAAGLVSVADGTWSATTNPAAFYFEVAGPTGTGRIERMRIASTGNVGIGTTAPTQKLEINGGLRLNTGVAKPACTASTRGTLWFQLDPANDILYVCAQSAGAPIWKAVTMN